MSSTMYQFSNATKSILENQLQVFSALTNHWIEATEKLNDLNMAVIKASVDESNETAKQLLSVKDQGELLNFLSNQPKLISEKSYFYNQHVSQILSDTQENVDKVIEGQIIQAKDNVTTLVAGLTKNEDVVSVWKSSLDQTEAGYEQVNKVVRNVTESVMENVAKQFMHSVENTGKKSAKK